MSKINLLGNVDNTTNLVSSATKDNTTKGPKLDLFGGIKSASKAAEIGELPTWDASGDLFKRYNNLDLSKYEKYFKVGGQVEIPAVNLDALNEGRARHQSTWAQIGNGLGKAGVTLVSAVGENTVGLVSGITSALYNWDISKLYDNSISNVFQGMQDWAQETMPNYNTREMEHAGFFEQLYNPGKGVANFWADKFANGFAYTLASIGTIIATGGYGAIGVAGNVGRMGLQGLAKMGKGALKNTLLQAGKTATKETARKGLRTFFREGMKRSGSTLKGVRQGVQDIAKGNVTKQALKNVDAGLSMAWAESSIEARDTYDTAYGSLVQQYMDENGFVDERQVPEEIKEKLRGEAQAASNVNFAMNLAIVGTTDVLMFGRMINGYTPKVKFNPISGTGKAAVDATLIEGSKLARMRRIWRNTKAYGAGAGTEMTQEGLQYVSNNFVTDYYLDKNSDGGQADIVNSMGNAFVDLFGTKEGKESMLLGFLTGGISTIRGTSKQLAQQDANTEALINRVHKNFLSETREKLERKEASARYTYLMDQAEKDGDIEAFQEAHMALIQNEVVSSIQEGNIKDFKERVAEAAEMTDEEFSETFGIDLETVKIDKSSYTSKLLNKIERIEEAFQEATQAFAPQERSGLYRWATSKLAPQELERMEIRNENMKIFRQQYYNAVMAMDNLDAKEQEYAEALSDLTNGEVNYMGMRDLIETTEQEEALNERLRSVSQRIGENLDDTGKPIDENLHNQLESELMQLQKQQAELLDTLSARHEKTLKGEFDKQFAAWASKVQKQKGRVDKIAKAVKAKQEIDHARYQRLQAVQAFNALKTEDGRTALLEDIGKIEKLRRNDKHSGVLMREAQEMGMSEANYIKLYAMSKMPGLNEKARKAIRKKQADLLRMQKRYMTMFRNMSDQQLSEALGKYTNEYILKLIAEELLTRANERRLEQNEERQRIEREQEEQKRKDEERKQNEEDRQNNIIKNEKDRRDKPETEQNIDDIEVITHTDPKLIEIDKRIAELEREQESEKLVVTPEADRIAELDKTLNESDRAFVDLMREKNKTPEIIDQKIKSSAKNTAQGNQLLQKYKAEDLLANPEGKKFADLVAAHNLIFGDGSLPSRTINDILYQSPDLRTQSLSNTYAAPYKVQQAVLAYEAYANRAEALANLRGQRIAIRAQNQSKTEVIPKNPSNETGRKQGQVISRNGQYINQDPQDRSARFDADLNVLNHRKNVVVNGQEINIQRELLTDPEIGLMDTEVKLRVLPTDEWKKLASDTDTSENKYPDYATIPVGIFMNIEGKEVLVGTLGYHKGNAEFTAERQRIYNNWKKGQDTIAVIKKYENDNISIEPAEGHYTSKAVSNTDIQNYRNEDGLGVQKSASELFSMSEQSFGQPIIGVITGSQFSPEGFNINVGLNAPNINVDNITVPKTAIAGSVGMIIKDPNGYDLFIPMQTRQLSDNAVDATISKAIANQVKQIEETIYADYSLQDLQDWGYAGSTVPVNASVGLANNFYKILAKKDSDGNFLESTHLFYTPFKDSMLLVGASNKAIKDNTGVKAYEITEDGIKIVEQKFQPAGLPNAQEAMGEVLRRKRYNVDASKFNNTNLQYTSPVTNIKYDNYQQYLLSEQESKNAKGEIQPRLNGAPGSSSAIIASDVYVRKTITPKGKIHRSIHANVNIAMKLPELDGFEGPASNTDMADPISHHEAIMEQNEKLLEQQIADMLNIPNFDPSQIDFSGGVIPGVTDLTKIEDDIINKEAEKFKNKQETTDPIKTNETKSDTSTDEFLDNSEIDIPDSDQDSDGIIGNEKQC